MLRTEVLFASSINVLEHTQSMTSTSVS